VKSTIQLRVPLTESQSGILQSRISELPFVTNYQEQQNGPALVALIECTPSQERFIKHILHDLGLPTTERGKNSGGPPE